MRVIVTYLKTALRKRCRQRSVGTKFAEIPGENRLSAVGALSTMVRRDCRQI